MKLNREKFELARAKTCMGLKEIEAAGIARGTLCNLMKGRDARPETIGKLARAMKLDITELI